MIHCAVKTNGVKPTWGPGAGIQRVSPSRAALHPLQHSRAGVITLFRVASPSARKTGMLIDIEEETENLTPAGFRNRGTNGVNRSSTIDSLGELPRTYGQDIVFLVAQEPRRLFAYWDIDISRHPGGQTFLRVYDSEDRVESETEVTFEVRNWYVPVQTSGARYMVEIGYYRRSVWNPLASSRIVESPRDSLSDSYDFSYATIPCRAGFSDLQEAMGPMTRPGEMLVETIVRIQKTNGLWTFTNALIASCFLKLGKKSRSALSNAFSKKAGDPDILPQTLTANCAEASGSSWETREIELQTKVLLSLIHFVSSSLPESARASWESAALTSLLQTSTSSSWPETARSSWETGALSSWLQAITSSWPETARSSWETGALSSWLQAVTSSWPETARSSWETGALSSWLQAVTSSWPETARSSWETGALSSWLQAVTSSWPETARSSWETGAFSSWSEAFIAEWIESPASSWGASEEMSSFGAVEKELLCG